MKLPSYEIDNFWISHTFYKPLIEDSIGKWMLFYDKKILDQKYLQIIGAVFTKNAEGIFAMKCSTMKKNDRASNENKGVLILYCDDSSNEEKIKKIGLSIKKIMCLEEKIYYKTNKQTETGTKATGQTKNSNYCV